MKELNLTSNWAYLIYSCFTLFFIPQITWSMFTYLSSFYRVGRAVLLFGIFWFLFVGPLFWYGVIQLFDVYWLRPYKDPSELDDLGQFDNWRKQRFGQKKEQ